MLITIQILTIIQVFTTFKSSSIKDLSVMYTYGLK